MKITKRNQKNQKKNTLTQTHVETQTYITQTKWICTTIQCSVHWGVAQQCQRMFLHWPESVKIIINNYKFWLFKSNIYAANHFAFATVPIRIRDKCQSHKEQRNARENETNTYWRFIIAEFGNVSNYNIHSHKHTRPNHSIPTYRILFCSFTCAYNLFIVFICSFTE